jgi:hypothetical protein
MAEFQYGQGGSRGRYRLFHFGRNRHQRRCHRYRIPITMYGQPEDHDGDIDLQFGRARAFGRAPSER